MPFANAYQPTNDEWKILTYIFYIPQGSETIGALTNFTPFYTSRMLRRMRKAGVVEYIPQSCRWRVAR